MSASLAFMFPGQGSQALGMLADLGARDPLVRATFEEASGGADVDLWSLAQDGPESRLNRTEFTQPVLLAADIAVWRLWLRHGGERPVLLAGHSLGEYAALVAAGALDLAAGAGLVRERGRLMQEAVPEGRGAMAAVIGADDGQVEAACREASGTGVVVAANFNAPGQVVIGGDVEAVEQALAVLAGRGIRKTVRLPVSVPSHTPLMREAADRLGAALVAVDWHTPEIPVLHNVDAAACDSPAAMRDALQRQLHLPVRWTACMQGLVERGVARVAECGPGKVLTGLAKRIDRALEARSLGSAADFDAALGLWRG